MLKKQMFEEMVRFYNDNANTHDYLIGYKDGKVVRFVIVHLENIADYAGLRGSDKSLRAAHITKDIKKRWTIREHARKLMTVDEFENGFKAWVAVVGTKYNRGHYFEYLMCEHEGLTWTAKSPKSFMVAPDMVFEGQPVQVKFGDDFTWCEYATFAKANA